MIKRITPLLTLTNIIFSQNGSIPDEVKYQKFMTVLMKKGIHTLIVQRKGKKLDYENS
ncbi:hypothetical protein [Tenacibaculum halocynthiae]|uniref:hypothetical protein n=1 Tax=Tenacibaculum halocynthiae TaxID=1254437 RepID=UPI003D65C8F3